MAYRVVLTRSATKELDSLPLRTHDQVVHHLLELGEDPRVFGSEKLTAINAYKLRVGNYRMPKDCGLPLYLRRRLYLAGRFLPLFPEPAGAGDT